MSLGVTFGGLLVQGLNGEMLDWRDEPVTAEQERVLLINDKPGLDGIALDIMREGGIALGADMSGFALKLTAPNLQNVGQFDIRDHGRIDACLRELGVSRIILRSLIGTGGAAAPVEALRCLYNLVTFDVEIDPIEEWMVRPVRDDEQAPNVFGFVDVVAWELAYQALIPPPASSPSDTYYYTATATDEEAAE
jgi:hypothetical protein